MGVALSAYASGAVVGGAGHWAALALTVAGIALLWWLHQARLRYDTRRDELQRVILDSVPHILFYKDASSRYIGVNKVFEETFGVRSDDVIGKTDAELFGQSFHERFATQDGELLSAGEARTFEHEIPINGEIRHIESRRTSFYDANGVAIGIVGLAMDVTENRKLRGELEVSNARLSLALRAAQLGTWAWNPEADELDLDAFEGQMFGLDEGRHSIAALLAGENIHPEDLEPVRNAARRALREGVAVGYEFRAPDKAEGGWRWVEGSAIRHVEPGRATRLIGVNRDITERKRQELELTEAKQEAERAVTALAQSRAELELALRSGLLGVWHSESRRWGTEPPAGEDLDRPVEWDANVRRIFGRGPDDRPTRRDYFEALHPEDRERVLSRLAEAMARGGDYADQYRIVLPDGRVRAIAVHATHTVRTDPGTGEPREGMTGIIRDITEEEGLKADLREMVRAAQQTSADLEQARADLELALRSGRLGVWHSEFRDVSEADDLGDPGLDDPVDWDANVRRIFGRSPSERITRRDFFAALHPDDRDRVLDHLSVVGENGGYYTDRYRAILPDGQVRWVEVHAAIEKPGTSKAGGRVTGIARDITDEENLKADLRQKAAEAQQAAETKARFLAMMSHEIRTPLNGVVGMIELLAETPMSSEQQQMLKSCKDSAFVLLAIINDILDFSKVEAGKLELDYTGLSLRRLVEDVGEALGSLATQRGIDLDVLVRSEVPDRVRGDSMRLRQVLTNLIGNAIKFTERGGVSVDVALDPQVPDGQAHVRFDIVDSGVGMDEATIRGLFQPFQQADAATTRRYGGTGLGLSIVKHLTELMGGRVECESRPQRGSRFSIVIPFEVVADGPEEDRSAIGGVRILALVASERRRQIFSALLRESGASVECVDSIEAVHARALADGGFGAVLLDRDWSISERAGLRRRFLETPALAALPFVVVRSNEAVQARLIPAATLINGNPVTRTGLVHGIATALGRKSPLVPTLAPAVDAVAPTVSREQEQDAGRLILLAEDNPTNREVISLQLARLGYLCDMAVDGEQAWEMLQSGRARYGLLLTDCHMPRLDGWQLTARIREREKGGGAPALPIIAITANALHGERERCLALGMNGYVAKPLQMDELGRTLAANLPSRPASGQDAVVSAVEQGSGFATLAALLGGNEAKLRHVLEIFVSTTAKDRDRLGDLYDSGDRRSLHDLAHKLKSGCWQLGDEKTALAFEALEAETRIGPGDAARIDRLLAAAQEGLRTLLARVEAYLSARDVG